VLEFSIIQTRGFTNVAEHSRITGFQLLVRMPNYRGAWGSLIDGADVTVDGRAFSRESTWWTLRGRPGRVSAWRKGTAFTGGCAPACPTPCRPSAQACWHRHGSHAVSPSASALGRSGPGTGSAWWEPHNWWHRSVLDAN
jgi:hypothetical protein